MLVVEMDRNVECQAVRVCTENKRRNHPHLRYQDLLWRESKLKMGRWASCSIGIAPASD